MLRSNCAWLRHFMRNVLYDFGPFTGALGINMDIEKSIAYFKQTFCSDARLDIELEGKYKPFCVKYSDDFSIFFLCDCGESYRIVQNRHLDDSGIGVDELLRIGRQNLRVIADTIKITRHEDLLYFSGSGDFEASLLLVSEIWNDWLKDYCPNGYIAALPTRDILVVSDKKNVDGIEKLMSIIDGVWPEGDHLLTNSLYHFDGQKWNPYKNA